MTANQWERAVIAAARVLAREGYHDHDAARAVIESVQALDAADLPQEIGWHEVAAGDRIKSAKNGKFYEVTGVISLQDGRRQLTIDLAGSPKAIVRPTPEEPRVTVRRGQDGAAVDVFVNVFTSGGA